MAPANSGFLADFPRVSLLSAICLVFAPALLFASPAPQSPGSQPPASLPNFANVPSLTKELDRISDALSKKPSLPEMIDLRNTLPNQWTVSTSDDTYTISTNYLRTQLAAGKVDDARVWSAYLSAQLQSYSAQDSALPINSRAELDRILAGPEFASVHPPTAWDIFRQRVNAWLLRQLERLFAGLDRYPIGGQIIFWVIMAAGVGFIAVTIFRFLVSRDRLQAMPTQEFIVVYRTWQEWVRAAREAAARNDFREAIHSAYWAAITRLQDADALPKDFSKTPREYLRSVSASPSPGAPSLRPPREPLFILTSRLEQIWYGNRRAASEDFSDALRQLENLGCHLD